MKRRRPKHWHYLYELLFPNGKRYIGYARDAQRRWDEHAKLARLDYFETPLYEAIRKYGWETIRKRVILIGDRDYILQAEVLAIAAFKTMDREFGYNLAPGGIGSPSTNPEVSEKIRQAKLLHWQDPEYQTWMSAQNTGRVMTPEQNEKNAAARRALWEDQDWRANQIAKRVGKKHNEEHKIKIGVGGEKAWARDPERHTAQTNRLLGNTNTLGNVWINDGTNNRSIPKSDPIPDGWRLGMLSNHREGRKIITDGSCERRIYPTDPLPEGWWFGRRPDVKFGPKPSV